MKDNISQEENQWSKFLKESGVDLSKLEVALNYKPSRNVKTKFRQISHSQRKAVITKK
jgi:hypothetical protein